MDDIFGWIFVSTAAEDMAALPGINDLVIFLSIMTPLFSLPPDKRRGSYDKSTGTYYTGARIDYDPWIGGDWKARVESYAGAVRKAIERIARTRITEVERAQLLNLVDRSAVEAVAAMPDPVEPLQPDLIPVFEAVPVKPVTCPATFKLYRRDDEGLHYHEAWGHDGEITEHWGVCGSEGQTRIHPYDSYATAERIMASIRKAARECGFRPIPDSRHRQLVVEVPFTDGDSLDVRHQLEDFLDNRLGWLGLGHCDGGSAGSGTMEVFCIVVDMRVAKVAIARELKTFLLSVTPRVYEMKRG